MLTDSYNVSVCRLLLALCSLCVLCGDNLAQNFKTLHDGVEYAQLDHNLGGEPVKINLLRLDLKKVRLDVHHAFDKAIGLETTSSIAKRNGAVAAINAGFFRLDKSEFAGDAAGILQIDRQLWSESTNNRSAIAIQNGGQHTIVEFGNFQTEIVAGFGVDSEFAFHGINRDRKANEIVLYTPQYGATTRTDPNSIEIQITGCEVREFSRWCNKTEVSENSGNSPIPSDGFVVSIGKGAIEKSNNILYFAKRTSSRPLHFENTLRLVMKIDFGKGMAWNSFEDVTNGVSRLIRTGKIDITWEQEKASRSFAETRHPRTAVAKLKGRKFLMMTVDGRQPGVSVGMSLQELAEYLISLGAVDAMNLDGGGSTTMFLDSKVVNTPSDKEGERKVSDAILVTLRKPSTARK